MKKRAIILAALCVLLMTVTAWAAPADLVDWDSLHVYGDEALPNTRIDTQNVGGSTCLFLPSNVSAEAVTFHMDLREENVDVIVSGAKGSVTIQPDQPVDLVALCGEGSCYDLSIQVKTEEQSQKIQIKVYPASRIPAMYLVSDDPVNQGREWVEASPDKENKATGGMVLQTADGNAVYNGALTQIKGRGNSTWKLDKKPYQIKLDKKTDLLETGDKDNKNKTWVLLANYCDLSAVRNTLALGLGAEMGMDSCVENRMVELYYDGEYRGTYLLCEKVEVNSGRVDITDLEDANDAANPGVDLETLETSVDKTANGATYTYCVGMNNPANISGGYLLEMEVPYRTADEVCYFYTTRNNYVVVKSPEFASKEQMDYIASLYQEYEDALFHDGTNPDTGKKYTDYVDLESTAMCYIVNELSKNLDGFRTSAYLYKEAGVDQMKMGPLWDYDLGFGVGAGSELHLQHQQDPEGMYTARSVFAGMLYQQGDFREMVRDIYVNSVYPVIDQVVLGKEDAVSAIGALRSLDYYRDLYKTASDREFVIWRGGATDWLNHVDWLENYLRVRCDYLLEEFSAWNGQTYQELSMYLDVDEGKWYNDEIILATKYGLMKGTGIAVFSPETMATRAQVVQTLFNMEKPLPTNYTAEFTDLDRTAWYMLAVNWATEQNVVQGYEDGSFRPNQSITRQELVTLLYRFNGSPKVTGNEMEKFSDAGSVYNYARTAMEWAVESGVIQGYNDNTIRPKETTRRCELAAIIVRYYEKFVLTEQ